MKLPAVGTTGEFTASWGEVCQCVVTGNDLPYSDTLIIDYTTNRNTTHPQKITDAYIPARMFRPDER